jgi:hypothetical protein
LTCGQSATSQLSPAVINVTARNVLLAGAPSAEPFAWRRTSLCADHQSWHGESERVEITCSVLFQDEGNRERFRRSERISHSPAGCSSAYTDSGRCRPNDQTIAGQNGKSCVDDLVKAEQGTIVQSHAVIATVYRTAVTTTF